MRTDVYYGGAETLESRVPGREDGLRGFAFDLQRFAASEVVAVVVGDDKVTLTLPDLSQIAKGDTITLKDSAGITYGTIKDEAGYSQLMLYLNENCGVTHIDATGSNTGRSVEVQHGGGTAQWDVVCIIKNGNDIGSFSTMDKNFFLRNTIPKNRILTLLDGVITWPAGNYSLDVSVETSTGLTLKGVRNYADYDWSGTLTINPLGDSPATGKIECDDSSAYYKDPKNASFQASKGCMVMTDGCNLTAGADGASGKADGSGKVTVTGGEVLLLDDGEVAIEADSVVTAAWEDNASGTYQFAAGAKASLKCEYAGWDDEAERAIYNKTATLTAGEAVLGAAGLCLTIEGTEYQATQAGTKLAVVDGNATLTAGGVLLDKGESIYVGTTEYKSLQAGTELACDSAGNFELLSGAVQAGGESGPVLSVVTAVTEDSDGNVTLTLPDLSQIAKGDTITLKDSAGKTYGTIKDEYGDTDKISLTLNENCGVTHIDATGSNTGRSVQVQHGGGTAQWDVVCIIKNGNDIGSFSTTNKNFFLGNTIPKNKILTLLDGVITWPAGNWSPGVSAMSFS